MIPVDWEQVEADTLKSYAIMRQVAERMFTFDFDACYRDYAAKLGKGKLTDPEKRQALLNAIIKQT